jgi:hypothetical protein
MSSNMCVGNCWCAAAAHGLDEDEVVQAQVRRDVPAVHVRLYLLPCVSTCYLSTRPCTV